MKLVRLRNAVIVGTLAAAVIFGVCEYLRGPRSLFVGFDRGVQRAYETILIGASKQDVLSKLGQPIRMEPKFCLPQVHGYEHLFVQAGHSTATEYYLWINGINWYYCIGFDSNNKVVIKGEGHS